jgi:hypothetical protein
MTVGIATVVESDTAIIDFCERMIHQCDVAIASAEAQSGGLPTDLEWIRQARHHAAQTVQAIESKKPIPPQSLEWFLEGLGSGE